jgi:hypothetical protein
MPCARSRNSRPWSGACACRTVHPLIPLLAIGLVRPATAPPSHGSAPGCAGDSRAPRFVWRSAFWLNLHNFLHHSAKLEGGIHDDAPAAIAVVYADTVGTRALTPGERERWDAALHYYLTNQLARGMMDSAVQRINERLARATDSGNLEDVVIDSGVRRVLIDVAPIYRAVWWPLHDRRNREWMRQLQKLLAGREARLFEAVSRGLGASWSDTTVIVDASVYATWAGAYSTQHPTHITLSSNARGNQGTLGVETLVHEAGHGISAGLDSALATGASLAHRALPSELGHLALFFTAGHAVTQVYPGHVPFADVFRLWNQNDAARSYHAILTREWQPYLDGRRSFADAVGGIVRSLPNRAGE